MRMQDSEPAAMWRVTERGSLNNAVERNDPYRRRNELGRIAGCEVRWFSCHLRNYLWAEQAMKSKTRVSCENCVCAATRRRLVKTFPPSVGLSLEDRRSVLVHLAAI